MEFPLLQLNAGRQEEVNVNVPDPQSETVNSGEALVAGDFVYIGAAGTAFLADASASGRDATGFVKDTVAIATPIEVHFEGINDAVTGKTVGARQYLSETPGESTETPVAGSGKIHQYLGDAHAATKIGFEATDGVDLV